MARLDPEAASDSAAMRRLGVDPAVAHQDRHANAYTVFGTREHPRVLISFWFDWGDDVNAPDVPDAHVFGPWVASVGWRRWMPGWGIQEAPAAFDAQRVTGSREEVLTAVADWLRRPPITPPPTPR